MENSHATGEITVLKISPQAGTTFLPKSLMNNLVSKHKNESVRENLTVSEKLKIAAKASKTTLELYRPKAESAMLKSTSMIKVKPNILQGNKRKSCPSSIAFKRASPKIKCQRKSEIVPLPLEALGSYKPKQKDDIICISDTPEENEEPSGTKCAFCHLNSNQVHGLGCLYGPYKVSASDVVKKIEKCTKNEYKIEINSNQSGKLTAQNPKIELNEEKLECNIHVPDVKNSNTLLKKGHCFSVGNAAAQLENNTGMLQVHQAVDHLLVDQTNPIVQARLKRSNPVLMDDKIRIPGLKEKCLFPRDKDSEKSSELPNIETINVLHNNKHKMTFHIKEIWTHGYCALYASGVYAIGDRLYGLHEAVEDAKKAKCKHCGKTGATISANNSKRNFYHYPCAIKNNISLANFNTEDDET